MRQRSSYPKPFKAQVVQERLQPGASISSVAISHGINANVIRKWMRHPNTFLAARLRCCSLASAGQCSGRQKPFAAADR
ncbi:ISPpu14-like transposase, Orf1 [Pseudomonas putida S11]|nr:ISPpu14-like transposase, Orf1 [Pseudomonas putida S11]